MDCRDVMEYVFKLDNDEALPAAVAQHLSTCESCRTHAEQLGEVLTGIQREWAVREDPDLTERIMSLVAREASGVAHDQPTRLRSWIIVGALILVGVTGLRFSEVMTMLRQSVGPIIDVAMSVILGIFLTGYICMLVGSNMGRVLRIFRHR